MTPCKLTGRAAEGVARDCGAGFREALLTSNFSDLVQEDLSPFQQVLAYRKIVEDLRQFIFHDPLTGLPSWKLFNQRLTAVLDDALQNGHSFAVFFLDLDRFKHINHTFGHEVGDRLLRLFVDRIVGVLEPDAILSRKGGDRFFLLLPDVADDKQAEATAARIMNALREPFAVEGQETFLTISIGISRYPQGGSDAVTLLKNADAAMNKAKEGGRNTCRFFCDELHAKARRHLQIENLLRKALDRNEFYLRYQPQFRIASSSLVDRSGLMQEQVSGRMIGCEALLRWNSSELGPISPVEFIPIAEATGMIEPIGEWVIQTACEQNRRWQEAGFEPFRMAINLSPRQLFNPNFEGMVYRQLWQTKLDPCWLEMEVTENILMLDIHEAADKLNRLRNLGMRISVDDFGTGYSSLSYLKKLPIDCLKIDRSFVQDLERCCDNTAIVQAIIGMAKQLKLSVIAEGVETEDQAAFLSRNGCTDLQGYYFCRPLTADQLTDYLAESPGPQAECCPGMVNFCCVPL